MPRRDGSVIYFDSMYFDQRIHKKINLYFENVV